MLTLDFSHLDDSDFEEFCYRLLHELGFVNLAPLTGHFTDAVPPNEGMTAAA